VGTRPIGLVRLEREHLEHALHRGSDRCSSENELTMFHTGLSSRNVYHWNAMMSPIDARPAD
jgi:hypothetical protein